MPKAACYTLVWSRENQTYQLFFGKKLQYPLLQADEEGWFTWLETHRSFSFHGQFGSFSLQKEQRPRSRDGYWYAYRRQGKHMGKCYVGTSRKLSMPRLEAVAQALREPTRSSSHPASQHSEVGREHAACETPHIEVREGSRSTHSVLPSSLPPTLTPQEPLLLAKLRPPRLPSLLIPRERLYALLDQGLQGKLTLICAPAGSGKTTLVNQWLNEQRAQNARLFTAWLSLDPEDNDPVRFWQYMLTCCQRLPGEPGRSSLALLSDPRLPPFALPPLKTVLTSLLNDLIREDSQAILVLEDYHVITASLIHELLTSFVDYLPPSLQVVLLTRSEPPFPLARWRARNELVELRAADLSFSREETQLFLQRSVSVPLSPDVIAWVHHHLEGWVTGLRLLALAFGREGQLQHIEDVFATLNGKERRLLDYFVSEVLDAQPEPIQLFLLHTSFLNRLSASLCDTVMQQRGSLYLLEAVQRAGLFLQPLDGTEQLYRYHALFAEAMQVEACQRFGKEVLEGDLCRASAWYEEQGMLPEAVELALQARDFAHAARLIEELTGPQRWISHRESQTLSCWLQQVPEPVLHAAPGLCFFLATQLTFTSESYRLVADRFAQVEAFLHRAEQSWQRENQTIGLGRVCAFRAMLAVRQGEVIRASALAKQALLWLPEEQELWRSIALGVTGEGERWKGQLDAAQQTHLAVLSRFEATNNYHGKLVTTLLLGDVYREQGMLHQASVCYQQVFSWTQATGNTRSDYARALLGLAQLSLEWNDRQRAETAAQEVLELSRNLSDEPLQIRARFVLAQVLAASGEQTQALGALQALLARIDTMQLPHLFREIHSLVMRLELSSGNLCPVQHWISSRPQNDEDVPFLQCEQEELLFSRLLLAQGSPQAALDSLDGFSASAIDAGRRRSTLEIQVLMALAHQQLHQTQQARQMLREVLSLARVQGYLHLFLSEGEAIDTLLRSLVSGIREKPLLTYLQAILSAFDTQRASPLIPSEPASLSEQLSSQERQVLGLLASGLSRKEIAQMLVISLNTVKTHLQRIYQKLQVRNRVQASEIARRLEL